MSTDKKSSSTLECSLEEMQDFVQLFLQQQEQQNEQEGDDQDEHYKTHDEEVSKGTTIVTTLENSDHVAQSSTEHQLTPLPTSPPLPQDQQNKTPHTTSSPRQNYYEDSSTSCYRHHTDNKQQKHFSFQWYADDQGDDLDDEEKRTKGSKRSDVDGAKEQEEEEDIEVQQFEKKEGSSFPPSTASDTVDQKKRYEYGDQMIEFYREQLQKDAVPAAQKAITTRISAETRKTGESVDRQGQKWNTRNHGDTYEKKRKSDDIGFSRPVVVVQRDIPSTLAAGRTSTGGIDNGTNDEREYVSNPATAATVQDHAAVTVSIPGPKDSVEVDLSSPKIEVPRHYGNDIAKISTSATNAAQRHDGGRCQSDYTSLVPGTQNTSTVVFSNQGPISGQPKSNLYLENMLQNTSTSATATARRPELSNHRFGAMHRTNSTTPHSSARIMMGTNSPFYLTYPFAQSLHHQHGRIDLHPQTPQAMMQAVQLPNNASGYMREGMVFTAAKDRTKHDYISTKQRKQAREKERRAELTIQFQLLASILKDVDDDGDLLDPNSFFATLRHDHISAPEKHHVNVSAKPQKKQKSSHQLQRQQDEQINLNNRVEIISRTIEVMHKLRKANLLLKQKVVELSNLAANNQPSCQDS